jgi:hypothetical protein
MSGGKRRNRAHAPIIEINGDVPRHVVYNATSSVPRARFVPQSRCAPAEIRNSAVLSAISSSHRSATSHREGLAQGPDSVLATHSPSDAEPKPSGLGMVSCSSSPPPRGGKHRPNRQRPNERRPPHTSRTAASLKSTGSYIGTFKERSVVFSTGSHMGTKVPIQLPFWGGVSFLQPMRSIVLLPLAFYCSPGLLRERPAARLRRSA